MINNRINSCIDYSWFTWHENKTSAKCNRIKKQQKHHLNCEMNFKSVRSSVKVIGVRWCDRIKKTPNHTWYFYRMSFVVCVGLESDYRFIHLTDFRYIITQSKWCIHLLTDEKKIIAIVNVYLGWWFFVFILLLPFQYPLLFHSFSLQRLYFVVYFTLWLMIYDSRRMQAVKSSN